MKNMVTKKICSGVNLTYIPEEKFKTTLISFVMFTPIDKKTVSANAIIPHLLSHSCRQYPSLQNINLKLEELYGTDLISKASKIGDNQVLTISASGLSSRYIPDSSDNSLEIAKLLNEIIFNPDIKENTFKSEKLAQEKRQLIEDIESELNDKKTYAIKKCTEIMCKNEKFGIPSSGTIESAKMLNEQDAFNAWKNLLTSSHIEIMVIGSCNHKLIFNEFKKNFDTIERNASEISKDIIVNEVQSIKEIYENMDVVQAKLVMGFRTGIAKPDPNVEAVKVMNALLGGSPQSKLFLNVREKLSLCYYCSSNYISEKGILFIQSGVQEENILKAKQEILNQIEDIQLGNFTEKELSETKMYMAQAIEKVMDSQESLGLWYAGQALDSVKYSPDEMIEKINKVKREDIIKSAQSLKLDTVYILSQKGVK